MFLIPGFRHNEPIMGGKEKNKDLTILFIGSVLLVGLGSGTGEGAPPKFVSLAFHIYTGGFRALVAYEQQGIHLIFVLVLVYLLIVGGSGHYFRYDKSVRRVLCFPAYLG